MSVSLYRNPTCRGYLGFMRFYDSGLVRLMSVYCRQHWRAQHMSQRGFTRAQKGLITNLSDKFGPTGYSVYKLTSRSRVVQVTIKVLGDFVPEIAVPPGDERVAFERLCKLADVITRTAPSEAELYYEDYSNLCTCFEYASCSFCPITTEEEIDLYTESREALFDFWAERAVKHNLALKGIIE
jgi:hypothetical protein